MQVLTAVLCLAHDNEVEENRVVATQLLGALAATVGRDLCCQFVLPEIVSLADDPVFRVRKAAAMKIGSLCSVVGEALSVQVVMPLPVSHFSSHLSSHLSSPLASHLSSHRISPPISPPTSPPTSASVSAQRLLPVFEVLSRDEIWGVRKASVESLAEVAAVMPAEVRRAALPARRPDGRRSRRPHASARAARARCRTPARASASAAPPPPLITPPHPPPPPHPPSPRLPSLRVGTCTCACAQVRTGQLVDLFRDFHDDGSRWVRSAPPRATRSG